jgi:F0F1-type ATP synthase assembly protein I
MKEHTPQSYWHDALMAFGRMSGWIAGPIVIALFLGKWLDRRFGTEPYFFVGVTAIAFIVSVYGLAREGASYKRSVESKNQTHGGTDPHNN